MESRQPKGTAVATAARNKIGSRIVSKSIKGIMTEDQVKRTQTFMKTKFDQDVSEDEAKDINERITTYFRLLHIWKQRERSDSYTQDEPENLQS